MNHCIGCVWQGLGSRRVVGVTSVRKSYLMLDTIELLSRHTTGHKDTGTGPQIP